MTKSNLSGYRLRPAAEADLEEIWRYTAGRWSPDQADRYLDALASAFETLVSMPEIAHERGEFRPPVRIHPSAQHLIVYQIGAECLDIIRVLGGRQNWQGLLDRLD